MMMGMEFGERGEILPTNEVDNASNDPLLEASARFFIHTPLGNTTLVTTSLNKEKLS